MWLRCSIFTLPLVNEVFIMCMALSLSYDQERNSDTHATDCTSKTKKATYTQDIINAKLHGKYACNTRFWLVDCRSRCPHTSHTQSLNSLQPLKRYNIVYIPWLMSRNKWILKKLSNIRVWITILAIVKNQLLINPNIFVVILEHITECQLTASWKPAYFNFVGHQPTNL